MYLTPGPLRETRLRLRRAIDYYGGKGLLEIIRLGTLIV